MVQAILVWVGAVLALGLLLVMALGPVIVEIDAWRYERRHNKRRPAASPTSSASFPASELSAVSQAVPPAAAAAPTGVPRHAA